VAVTGTGGVERLLIVVKSTATGWEDLQWLLVNKVDAGNKKPLLDALPISAKTGQGLDAVRRKILHALAVTPKHVDGEAVVFTPRQERLLARAASGRLDPEEARQELIRGGA